MNYYLKNGTLVDPKNNIEAVTDLWISDGKVASVGALPESANASDFTEIDCTGKLIMPGFIDLHVHFRDPGFTYKETLTTGSNAAAAGGFTGVCPMPNTKPATDTPEKIAELLTRAKTESKVNIFPIGAVTIGQEGKELCDLKGMKDAGAVAISEDGKSVMDINIYKEAMEQAGTLGLVVMAHCEDKNLVGKGVVNAGPVAERYGLPGISNAVEDIITARDIFLAGQTGAQLHLCHCSTEASVGLVKLGKELGIKVSAEVCPHHFAMNEEEITADDGMFKMNPPLRSRKDMETLCDGLANGTMDCISTDHAPHSAEEKAGGFLTSPFGIVGLETAFSLAYTKLVKGGYMGISDLVRRMSVTPAEIIHIERGSLNAGAVADLVIANTDEYTIDPSSFESKGRNTPFGGHKVFGQVEKTFVNGELVFER